MFNCTKLSFRKYLLNRCVFSPSLNFLSESIFWRSMSRELEPPPKLAHLNLGVYIVGLYFQTSEQELIFIGSIVLPSTKVLTRGCICNENIMNLIIIIINQYLCSTYIKTLQKHLNADKFSSSSRSTHLKRV